MSPPAPARRRPPVVAGTALRVLPAAVFAAAVVALLGPSLAGTHVALPHDIHLEHLPWRATQQPGGAAANPELRDTIDTYYPVQHEIFSRLRAGRDVTWLRAVSLGFPGMQFVGWGALSPFNAPALVAPFDLAWSWSQGLRLFTAMGGAYLLVRSFGAGRPAATVAGVSFGLSGFMVGWLGWPQSHVGAVVPWLLWTVRRTAAADAPWWGLPALTVAATALWLGGFPALALYGLVAALPVAGHALAGLRGHGRRLAGRRAVAVAAGVGLGGLLAAFTLLPTGELLGELDLSARQGAWRARVTPEALWTFLVPGLYGDVVEHPRWVGGAYVETVGYAGVATLLLALPAWLLSPRRAGVWLFTGLGVGFGLLAYGFPPFVAVARSLPGFSTNAPTRVLLLAALAIAVVGGLGADALERWLRARAGPRRPALVVLLAAAVLLGALLWAFDPVGWLRATATERLAGEALAEAGRVARRQALLAVLVVAAAAAVTAAARSARGRRMQRVRAARLLLGAGLVAVVTVDLVVFASGWNVQVPRARLFPDAPGIAELRALSVRHRVAGSDDVGQPNTHLEYGLRELRAHAFLTARQRGVLREEVQAAFASPTRWDLRGTASSAWEPWLSAAGVAAVLSPPGVSPPPGWTAEDLGPVQLLRNPHALPVVHAAPSGRAVPAGRARQAVAATAAPRLAEVAFVETADPARLPGGGSARVLAWTEDGGTVRARVSSTDGAVVTALDAALPGWRATIDGQPAAVVVVNHLFVGVVVPAGEHVVELSYRPPGARAGRAVSAVAAAVAAVLSVGAWRRRGGTAGGR